MAKRRYRNDFIVQRMDDIGYTVERLKSESKLSHETISRARAGDNLSVDTLAEIAKPLSLSMKFLFDFDLPIERLKRALVKTER